MAFSVSPIDLDRLSAYLDDELSRAEREGLELRLKDDPALRAELENLRRTKAILRTAPNLPVPRNFTLDPVRYQRPLAWWANYQAMERLGALGALAAVLLIAFGTFFSAANQGPISSVPAIVPANVTTPNSVAVLPSLTPVPLTSAESSTTGNNAPESSPIAPTSPASSALIAPTRPAAVAQVAATIVLPSAMPSLTIVYSAAAGSGGPSQQSSASAKSSASGSGGANADQLTSLAPQPAMGSAALQKDTATPSTVPTTVALDTIAPLIAPTYPQDKQPSSTQQAAQALATSSISSTDTPEFSINALKASPTPNQVQAASSNADLLPLPRLLTIIGIALLVLGGMLFGIGYLRVPLAREIMRVRSLS